MGFSVEVTPLFIVEYRAPVGPLIEDEYVHVFCGQYDGAVAPDPSEVGDYKWLSFSELEADLASNSHRYTAWFLQYMRLRRNEIAALVGGPR